MQVGFYQFDLRFGETANNLEMVTAKLEQADADLIVLPELFASGYQFLSQEQARFRQGAAPPDSHSGCAQR